jgi:paraquat-inducible protein A
MDERQSLAARYPKHWYVPALTSLALVTLLVAVWLPTLRLSKIVILNETYSIWRGIVELWKSEHYILALIIFFFSMLFPVAKLVMLLAIWFKAMNCQVRDRMLHWLGVLGKWSMLDVFVVAILVVLIKAGAATNATADVGIYLFAAAIMLSIIASLLVDLLAKRAAT